MDVQEMVDELLARSAEHADVEFVIYLSNETHSSCPGTARSCGAPRTGAPGYYRCHVYEDHEVNALPGFPDHDVSLVPLRGDTPAADDAPTYRGDLRDGSITVNPPVWGSGT